MQTLKSIFICLIVIFISNIELRAQCNTNTNICSAGNSGPFTFADPGQPVSTCLDFWGNGYAYILLYITEAGPLELLIEGDASNGFLDVAIFNIPSGSNPCDAILDNTNQISCNYASNASGCNQIGTYYSCPSSVSSPYVNVGDELMIIVENWSNASSNFMLQMAPSPAAQSGLGNPTISQVSTNLTTASSPYQMSAADNGGTWTGVGIDSNGLFDPSISGVGVFTVTYTLGIGTCISTDFIDVNVGNPLAIDLGELSLDCKNNKVAMNWSTISEVNCDYFKIESSYDALSFSTIDIVGGNGNSSTMINYSFIDLKNEGQTYYRLIEVDYNGKETVYGPFATKCEEVKELTIYPNPVRDNLKFELEDADDQILNYEIKSITGKLISSNSSEGIIDVTNLSGGCYFLTIKTKSHSYIQKFVRQ